MKKKFIIIMLILSVFLTGVNVASVTAAEMSDKFKLILNANGELELDYAPITSENFVFEMTVDEEFTAEYEEFRILGYNADYTKCTVAIIDENWNPTETHEVAIKYNYDASVLQSVATFVAGFPTDKNFFSLTDYELFNYWFNYVENPESDINYLANYSGELKTFFKNTNLQMIAIARGGMDAPYATECFGTVKIMHDGITYFVNDLLGASAKHVIYVPESTGSTNEELMAAAEKKINEYLRNDLLNMSVSDVKASSYVQEDLAYKDQRIAECEVSIAQNEGDILDIEEKLNDPLYEYDYENLRMMLAQRKEQITFLTEEIDTIKASKKDYEEGGEYHFLNLAENDTVFTAVINEEERNFVIVKDDDKMIAPTHKTVDLNTAVEISTESSEVPLDASVEAKNLTSGDEYERIMAALNVENADVFDISLFSANKNEYVTELENGKFEVRIPLKKSLEGKELIVYYVDAEGKITEHSVTEKNGYAVFTTDHFSVYTVAEKEVTSTPPKGPNTGDTTNLLLWIALAGISLGVLLKRARKA